MVIWGVIPNEWIEENGECYTCKKNGFCRESLRMLAEKTKVPLQFVVDYHQNKSRIATDKAITKAYGKTIKRSS